MISAIALLLVPRARCWKIDSSRSESLSIICFSLRCAWLKDTELEDNRVK